MTKRTMSDMCVTISQELGQLAVLTATVHDQLSPRAYVGLDVEAVQSLEFAHQVLQNLKVYTADLGILISCPCEVEIDEAVDKISLGVLADRLRCEVETLDPAVCQCAAATALPPR